MKWFAALVLPLALLALVVACEEEEEEAATATPSPAATATGTPEPRRSPEATPTPEAAGLELKLAVYDDTESSPADEVELWTKGLGSWYPDLTFGGDVTTIGPYEVGSSHELFVYPDGRGGVEIKVVLTLTDDMMSRSDRDMVSVAIGDQTVTVTATSIDGLEQQFAR